MRSAATAHTTTVAGPLGRPVDAEWRMLSTGHRRRPGDGPTAVVEMSQAAGRALLPRPSGDDPVRADTTGVGQLLLAARDAGAAPHRHRLRRLGHDRRRARGAVEAVGCARRARTASSSSSPATSRPRSPTPPTIFGPQKGATPGQVELLTQRLHDVAAYYRRTWASTSPRSPAPAPRAASAAACSCSAPASSRASTSWPDLVGLAARLERADLVVDRRGPPRPALLRRQGPRRRPRSAGPPAPAGVRPPPGPLRRRRRRPRSARRPPEGMEVRSLVALYGREPGPERDRPR